MLLLTWHGTILRVEQSQNRLIHSPLAPVRPVARDFNYTPGTPLPGAIETQPGPHPATIYLTRAGKTFVASAASPYPSFEAADPTETHALLPLPEQDIALLRTLLTTPHRHDNTDYPPATLHPGFELRIGAQTLNLAETPLVTLAVTPLPTEPATELHLRPATLVPEPITITGAAEPRFLPLTAHAATRDWFYSAATEPVLTSPQTLTAHLHRYDDVYLLNGITLFTPAGALLTPLPNTPLPPGIAREADDLFITESALTAPPTLSGPHALLASGDLVPITLPPDPALFAFPDQPTITPPALCRVETLFRLTGDLPATTLRSIRPRALKTLPATKPTRLFIQTGVAVPAPATFETSAAPTPAAFAAATAIIAAHGPALENLIFCAEGTFVIELTPDTAWRPRYSRLSDQLNLVHAVLPCPAKNGLLHPDPQALRILLALQAARPLMTTP
jgi:hypothetical protein